MTKLGNYLDLETHIQSLPREVVNVFEDCVDEFRRYHLREAVEHSHHHALENVVDEADMMCFRRYHSQSR